MALHRFIVATTDGRPVTVSGDGEQVRDFTYVGDAAAATVAAVEAEVAPASVFNVAGGSPATINNVLRRCRTTWAARRSPGTGPRRPAMSKPRTAPPIALDACSAGSRRCRWTTASSCRWCTSSAAGDRRRVEARHTSSSPARERNHSTVRARPTSSGVDGSRPIASRSVRRRRPAGVHPAGRAAPRTPVGRRHRPTVRSPPPGSGRKAARPPDVEGAPGRLLGFGGGRESGHDTST
jgi:hypothetical protein